MAATKNVVPSQLHDRTTGYVTIVNADASNYKSIIAATASDASKEAAIYSIVVNSDDTSNRDLQFAIDDGTNVVVQGLITIPAQSGSTTALPPIQIIANRTSPVLSRLFKDNAGNWFLVLLPGETLKAKAVTTVTSGKTISISAVGWNFGRSSS